MDAGTGTGSGIDLEILWIGFYALFALYGGYLMVDFLIWRLRSKIGTGHIAGFSKKRNKGKRLPVVSFDEYKAGQGAANKDALCQCLKIDSLGYWLKPAHEGDVLQVSYLKTAPSKGRVFGYWSLVFGGVLQWPFWNGLAMRYASEATQSGLGFLFFAALFIGCFWVFMRIVRYYY